METRLTSARTSVCCANEAPRGASPANRAPAIVATSRGKTMDFMYTSALQTCSLGRHYPKYGSIAGLPVELLDKIQLVYEDNSVIVVDKPAGLLTMATETERAKTVYADLRAYLNDKKRPERVFIVHRLDREASGLLVFAKTAEAKQRLQDQF